LKRVMELIKFGVVVIFANALLNYYTGIRKIYFEFTEVYFL